VKQFATITLGCKVNQYDGAALGATLEQQGWRRHRRGQPDLVIVNTCCVTVAAMAKSRQAIRRCAHRWPAAHMLVVGCYSDYDPRRLRQVLDTEGVAPNRAPIAGHHDDLRVHLEQVMQRLDEPSAGQAEIPPRAVAAGTTTELPAVALKARRLAALAARSAGTSRLEPLARFPGHQRAFVKVQDGCDAFCTFCVVPYTRCVVRSRPTGQILDECRRLVAYGHREIVLCGVFLGAFGRSTAIRRRWATGPAPLVELVRQVSRIPGLWRVRLSSLEPADVTDEFLDACRALPAFAPHLHLPLQSGSPSVLRRMNRGYTPEQFLQVARRARQAFDRPAISTDIIVGFPGESDEDFAQTLDLARAAGFMKIHAFPFSPIPGAAAWNWRQQAAPPSQLHRRTRQLAELEQRLAAQYRRQWVGGQLEGLVEKVDDRGVCRAVSDRYAELLFEAKDATAGQVARMRVTGMQDGLLTGRFLGRVC